MLMSNQFQFCWVTMAFLPIKYYQRDVLYHVVYAKVDAEEEA